MKFSEMLKLKIVATGIIPDGYNGQTREVIWRFDPQSGKTLTDWGKGFYDSPIPPAVDIREAYWLLENHPNARGFKIRPNTGIMAPQDQS